MNTVYLSLGSNIYPRSIYLSYALFLIEKTIGKIKAQSSVYLTQAWKMSEDAAFFYNLCVELDTELSADMLLQKLLEIEKTLYRVRSESQQYIARTIDIDILFFNSEIINTQNLKIPHPHIADRNFVLVPLSEIAGQYLHPIKKITLSELAKYCADKNFVTPVSCKSTCV